MITGEIVDSKMELVVLEGGGRGNRYYLDRSKMTLGRRDNHDESLAGVVTFPEPTVSRVHAIIEWDANAEKFLLTHRSRTNATLINGERVEGSIYINIGDRIKMGLLIAEFRVAGDDAEPSANPEPKPVESDLHLLQVTGPTAGSLHAINHDRFLIGHFPDAPEGPLLVRLDESAGDSVVGLSWTGKRVELTGLQGEPARLVEAFPGYVRVRPLHQGQVLPFPTSAALVLGQRVIGLAPTERAGGMSEAIKAGRECHPLQEGLRLDQERIWDLGEQHLLQVITGPLKGTVIYFDPVRMEGNFRLGNSGHEAGEPQLRIDEPDLGLAELEPTDAGQFTLHNRHPQVDVGHNVHLVAPGDQARLVSGDRICIGRIQIRYENLATQEKVVHYALRVGDQVLPFVREVNLIGYSSHCDLRINDRRLGPTHGVFELRDSEVVYQHRNLAVPAQLDKQILHLGDEAIVKPGDVIRFTSGLEGVLEEIVGEPPE